MARKSFFGSSERAKHQAPNPKLQRSSTSENTKPQKSMPGQTARRSVFELGAWCFFGAWSLEFGACRLDSQPRKKLRCAPSDAFKHFGIDCSKALARVFPQSPEKNYGRQTRQCLSSKQGKIQRKRTSHEQSQQQ